MVFLAVFCYCFMDLSLLLLPRLMAIVFLLVLVEVVVLNGTYTH